MAVMSLRPVLIAALTAGACHVTHPSVIGGAMSVELAVLAAVDGGVRRAPRRIKLLPEGEFASVDGRPANMEGSNTAVWRMTARLGARIVGAFRARKQKMIIDYEHSTLRAVPAGHPNPAAAWIVDLSYLSGAEAPDGAGLYADVEWTPAAAAMVVDLQYRYISPVFPFDQDTGDVLDLLHVAITNTPGLNTDALPELQAQLSALAHSSFSTPPEMGNQQEPSMKLLLAALGLTVTATEEAGLAALNALQGQVTSLNAQVVELKGKQFDPAQHIPLSEHKKVADQLAALSAASETAEHTTLMTAALADARILPANAEYWKKQPLAALKAFLVDAKPLAAALTATQTGGQAPGGGNQPVAALTAEDQAVCKQLGIKPEDYLKTKAVATA